MELQKLNNDGQNPKPGPENEKMDQNNEACIAESLFEEVESTCSTPYVSAASSPGRGSGPVSNGGFYYSAPASPMHFVLTASYPATNVSSGSSTSSVSTGFEFGSGSSANGSMSSADELFLDGMIRPMKLSTHLEKPQVLAPVLDLDQEAEAEVSESSSRSSSSAAGRSTSKSWVFLKEFLCRSKSEGRSNNKFWSTISFSPITNKDKKLPTCSSSSSSSSNPALQARLAWLLRV